MMIHRMLAGSLIAAPILMSAAETARLSIPSAASEAAKLALIAANRGTWEIFGWLTLALTLAWTGATLGLVEALRAARHRTAGIGGAIMVTGTVAFAMHQMQYVEVNAILSSSPDYIHVADQHGINGTAMEDATVVIQLIGLWLGPIILTAALARADLLAWWQFACVPTWVVLFAFTGSISPLFAATHLLLLPPFVATAKLLLSRRNARGGPANQNGHEYPSSTLPQTSANTAFSVRLQPVPAFERHVQNR
jgi:hypothetical protein